MNPYQNSFGGNIPQDVAGKQGENVIFIVYTLKDTPETLDKVKDACTDVTGFSFLGHFRRKSGDYELTTFICKNDRFSSPRNSYHRNVHAQTGALL